MGTWQCAPRALQHCELQETKTQKGKQTRWVLFSAKSVRVALITATEKNSEAESTSGCALLFTRGPFEPPHRCQSLPAHIHSPHGTELRPRKKSGPQSSAQPPLTHRAPHSPAIPDPPPAHPRGGRPRFLTGVLFSPPSNSPPLFPRTRMAPLPFSWHAEDPPPSHTHTHTTLSSFSPHTLRYFSPVLPPSHAQT